MLISYLAFELLMMELSLLLESRTRCSLMLCTDPFFFCQVPFCKLWQPRTSHVESNGCAAFWTSAKNIDVGVFHCCSIIFNSSSFRPTIGTKLNFLCPQNKASIWAGAIECQRRYGRISRWQIFPASWWWWWRRCSVFLPFSSFLMWNLTISELNHRSVGAIVFKMSLMAPYGVTPPLFAFTHFHFMAMISRFTMQVWWSSPTGLFFHVFGLFGWILLPDGPLSLWRSMFLVISMSAKWQKCYPDMCEFRIWKLWRDIGIRGVAIYFVLYWATKWLAQVDAWNFARCSEILSRIWK